MPTDETEHPANGAPTKPPRSISFPSDPSYWQILGEFIEKFALCEIMLFFYLSACANIPDALAKVFFSGFHCDQIADMIRKVWEVRAPDQEIKQKAEDAIVQLKAITDVRNNIVHYASYFDSDRGRISSNIVRARRPELIRELRVSPDIMSDLVADIEKATHHFTYAYLITKDARVSRADLANGLPTLTSSWRYKRPEARPQSLKKRRQRIRSERPKHGNPPSPSRE
jgi:hypothetical protein